MLHNIMEELVEQSLDPVLRSYQCCKCAKCRKDMMAVALNHLPPHYIVTTIGEAISKAHYMLDLQGQAELISEVVAAVEFVKDRPRHDVEEAPDRRILPVPSSAP